MLKEEIIHTTAPEPKKYKYLLNGEVLYFTREELLEREREINIKNDIEFYPEELEEDVERLIERLEEYDGDRFGHYLGCPELHKCFHEADAEGMRIVYYR
jgi:hypothetical protein